MMMMGDDGWMLVGSLRLRPCDAVGQAVETVICTGAVPDQQRALGSVARMAVRMPATVGIWGKQKSSGIG